MPPMASVLALAIASDQRMTSCVSTSRRSILLTAGGTLSAPEASVSRLAIPLSNVRSSWPSAMAMILGSSMARPRPARRKASCSARVARRVGISSVMLGSSIGLGGRPPATGKSPLRIAEASASRNGCPAGTVQNAGAAAGRALRRRLGSRQADEKIELRAEAACRCQACCRGLRCHAFSAAFHRRPTFRLRRELPACRCVSRCLRDGYRRGVPCRWRGPTTC